MVQNLHDTIIDFKNRYGVGRAIAAPQIGVFKRWIGILSRIIFNMRNLIDRMYAKVL